VESDGTDDALVMRPAAPRITLAAVFAGKPAAEWRALYAYACDRGPDIGLEIVPA